MVWLILMVVAIVMIVSYEVLVNSVSFTSVIGDTITSLLLGQSINIPTLNIVYAVLAGAVVMAVGLGLLYLDSRQALLELYSGNPRYVVWPKQIGDWLWNDIVNASRYDMLANVPAYVARIVVVAYAAKSVIGIALVLGSFAIPWGIDLIANLLPGWIDKSITQTVLNAGVSLLNLMVNQFGMLAFAYASIVLFADRFHQQEQTFYNDYAVMQRQR